MCAMVWEGRYFKPHEFDSPDAPGSGWEIKKELVIKLDEIRDVVGRPLIINSGFRTEDHNKKISGSVEKSAHTQGWAVDIKVSTSTERMELVRWALVHGFTRIGVAKTFVHLDLDPDKTRNVMWLYS